MRCGEKRKTPWGTCIKPPGRPTIPAHWSVRARPQPCLSPTAERGHARPQPQEKGGNRCPWDRRSPERSSAGWDRKESPTRFGVSIERESARAAQRPPPWRRRRLLAPLPRCPPPLHRDGRGDARRREDGGAGCAWVVEAVALADPGERAAGELRHVVGKSVCALEIALLGSQRERATGSGQRAATFSSTASQRRPRPSSAEIAARVASSHLERWQPHRFCSI